MSFRTIAATLLILATAGVARAGFVLVGNTADTGSAVPFGLDSDGALDPSDRYQQIYNANLFGQAPIAVTGLTFYATPSLGDGGTFNPVTYQVYLSTTSTTVAGLSGNLDGNVGANEALFATFTGTGNAPAEFTLSGTAFSYDPNAGSLLLDIRIVGQTSTGTFLGATFDAVSDFGGASASVGNSSSPADATPSGLVTGITFASVPEPSSLVLMGLGAAGLARLGKRRRSASA